MNKIIILIIAIFFSLTACGNFLGSKNIAENTIAPEKDFDTVNGSITIGSHSQVGDLSTVNGSVKIASDSHIGQASTVNGSIVIAENVTAESTETVNGSIKLGKNCQIEEDATTVNGSVTAQAGCVIGGDFETVNGKLKASNTKIEGDILTVNGNVILLDGSSVDDIIIRKPKGFFNKSKKKKPKIVLGKNVKINGDLEFERPVILYIHESVDVDDEIENAEIKKFSGDELPY